MTSKRQNPKSTKTVKKMAMLAGSMAAVGTMQANSQAAIQHVTGSPVSASYDDANGTQNTWDVDGDSTPDAFLVVATSEDAQEEEQVMGRVDFESTSDKLYFATTNSGDDFKKFAASDQLSTNNANFNTGSGELIQMSFPDLNGVPVIGLGSAAVNLDWGDNYIGFELKKGSDLHYGWANLNLDQASGTATITEWAWEDTPDTQIHIGATTTPQGGGAPVVPEPSSLALLALGAGGLFTYRARQKKLSADRSAEVTP